MSCKCCKPLERIEALAGFAREYLHRYGYLMDAVGEDVTDEVMAVEAIINEVKDGVRIEDDE